LEVNLAGFCNVWQNTPCTICHPAMAYLVHCVVKQCCQMV